MDDRGGTTTVVWPPQINFDILFFFASASQQQMRCSCGSNGITQHSAFACIMICNGSPDVLRKTAHHNVTHPFPEIDFYSVTHWVWDMEKTGNIGPKWEALQTRENCFMITFLAIFTDARLWKMCKQMR